MNLLLLKWLFYSFISVGYVQSWISTSMSRQQFTTQLSLSMADNNKPHMQRVTQPRPARRLNHAFKYLYRHTYNGTIPTADPVTYLQHYGGYTTEQIFQMNQSFPPLLTLSVQQQVHPKMEFLRHTLGISDPSQVDLPPYYWGARLEKVLAPRHAFLVHHQLPHGPELFRANSTLFHDFMMHARNAKSFAALCQRWQQQYTTTPIQFTYQQVEAFDALFGRGLMAAARNEWNQNYYNNSTTWAVQHNAPTAAQLINLLYQHGANLHERDYQGATLLHWASGTGYFEGVETLIRLGLSVQDTAARDGATPLHWAAAGTTAREFGTGGHADVCEYLIQQIPEQQQLAYINQCTKDGNSPLMWASWSGTLKTVKLLASYGAQSQNVTNRNGCTVAHWAASGGNVDVCRYLHEVLQVDFSVSNHGGNTPLTHAVAFGRSEVVKWLSSIRVTDGGEDGTAALELAKSFVQWQEGDARRTKILQLLDSAITREEG